MSTHDPLPNNVPPSHRVPTTILLLTAPLLVALTAFDAEAASCQDIGTNPGYNPFPVADTTRTDWMSHLPDDLLLSELSIPGTHESHSFAGGVMGRSECYTCQSIPLHMQLAAGIRAFDIRLNHRDDALRVYHGPTDQHVDFGSGCEEPDCGCSGILQTCVDFLQNHERETIFMRVKPTCGVSDWVPDHPCRGNSASFAQQVVSHLGYWAGPYVYNWPFLDCGSMPTLGDTRGKIVILQDFQRDYHLGNAEDAYWSGPQSCTGNFDNAFGVDLAVISWDRLSTFLGHEDGFFRPETLIVANHWISAVCSADFDSDGADDLAVTLPYRDRVDVYRRLPGGFADPISFVVAQTPTSLCAADIDADERPDIVVANGGNHNYITVLRNASAEPGDIDFSGEPRLVGNHPYAVAFAHFNDDDRPDLITAHRADNVGWDDYVKAWINDGWHAAGVLYFQQNVGYDTYPQAAVAADFDGDGLDDMAVSFRDGYIRRWRNTGTGMSEWTRIWPGGEPHGLDAADVDGDDDQDLIVTNAVDGTVTLCLNDGSFGCDYHTLAYKAPVAVTAEDIDLDGYADLVVTEYGPLGEAADSIGAVWGLNRVSVLRSDGNGTTWCPGRALGPYWDNLVIQDFYAIRGWTGDGSVETKIALILQHLDWARNTSTTHPDWMFVNHLSGIDWRDGELDCNIRPCEIARSTNQAAYFYLRDALDAGEVWRCGIVMADYPGDGLIDAVIAHNRHSGISGTLPAQNALNVVSSTDIAVTFATDMQSASINDSTFIVSAACSGVHEGAISYEPASRTATLDPSTDFEPGEIITALVARGIDTANGFPQRPYAWSFTTAADSGSGTFPTDASFSVGSYPRSLFSSDLNRDGHLDLVTANEQSDDVAVLLNHGDGTFVETDYYPAGAAPFSVFASDFDGDDDLDLAVANHGAPTITILMNDGAGVFGQMGSCSTGTGLPRSIFASDLNLDGHTDLVTANHITDDISVFLNEGDGTFAEPTSYPVGIDPRSVLAADLDGDGDFDIATANLTQNSVSVLLNRGNGSFSDQTIYPDYGQGPSSVFASDLDADGDLDLAVANFFSGNVSVLMNQGHGAFLWQGNYSVGANPSAVFASDLDGDGDLDLATANSGSENASVLMNDGDGMFADHTTFDTGTGPYSVFAADLNGDGVLDLATSNLNSSDVSVLLNTPTATEVSLTNALQMPNCYALHSPVPNPFDLVTSIAFDLPFAEQVSLRIFNVAGQCVRTLVDEPTEAGRHATNWDGRNDSGGPVAHGVYFIRMTAGAFTATQKLVRVR